MLDAEKGGHWRIEPAFKCHSIKQLYIPDTNVLITRFLTPEGVGEVQDFMPIHRDADARRHLVRRVVVVRGTLQFRMECVPRLNYGRDMHMVELARLRGAVQLARVHACDRVERAGGGQGRRDRRRVRTRAGRQRELLDARHRGRQRAAPPDPTPRPKSTSIAPCGTGAAGWPSRTYRGRWREMVNRSALDPQAAHLPAHRCHRGRADHQPARAARRARATGTTATPGSATPRSRCTRCCGWDSPTRPPTSCAG